MNADPSYKLALLHTSQLSVDVEAQITSKARSEPLLVILQTARENAAEALGKLVSANADNPSEIRGLQNEVTRFTEMVVWLRQMLADGPEADRQLDELQRQEVASFVIDDETAEALGISNKGEHDDD